MSTVTQPIPQHVTQAELAATIEGLTTTFKTALGERDKRIAELEATPAPMPDQGGTRKRRKVGQTPFQRYKAQRAIVEEKDVYKGLGLDFCQIAIAHGIATANAKAAHGPRTVQDVLGALGDEELAQDWGAWEKGRDAEMQALKSLTTDIISTGGALVAPEYGAELITYLISQQVLGRAGIRTLQTSAMQFVLGQATGGMTPAWRGEAQPATYTQGATGQRNWQMRRLTGTTAFSRQFVTTNFANAAEYFRGLLSEQMALLADITFLRGAVSAYAPTGIKWQVPATHRITQTGTSLANVLTDIFRLMGLLEDYNIDASRAVFIAPPRTRRGLAQFTFASGPFVFPQMQGMGDTNLFGHRFLTTTAIPTTLGGGTETEWSILAPQEAMAVYLQGMEVRSSFEVAYTNAAGNLTSAWENDELAVNCSLWADIRMLHPEGFAMITNSTI